ncbi:BrnA antitoxin family protein [bacterium]|nr:BrnA antitoxin family protein [bacterium]MBU3930388.1 BrnA antitoxin family protein [bacterium]
MKQLKKIPKFKTANEEIKFWDAHDSTDYLDWSKAKRAVFPNLKPTSRSIPVKLPNWLIEQLKFLAHKKDLSYQALLRLFVMKEVEKEMKAMRAAT